MRSPHGYGVCSESIVEGFGIGAGSRSLCSDPPPAAGPVTCGGLWAMTTVDSSSSVVIYIAHTYIGGGYVVSWSEAWHTTVFEVSTSIRINDEHTGSPRLAPILDPRPPQIVRV